MRNQVVKCYWKGRKQIKRTRRSKKKKKRKKQWNDGSSKTTVKNWLNLINWNRKDLEEQKIKEGRDAEKGRCGKWRRLGRRGTEKMIEGRTQEKGVGEEMRRWGGDESSWDRQPRWAGLLWGRRRDTCSRTHNLRIPGHHAASTSPPAVEAGGRRRRAPLGCRVHSRALAAFSINTHTHDDSRVRDLIKSEDGWTLWARAEEHSQCSCGRQQGWENFLHGFPLHLCASFLFYHAHADAANRNRHRNAKLTSGRLFGSP